MGIPAAAGRVVMGDADGKLFALRKNVSDPIRALLAPRAVAVIGASRAPSGIGHRIAAALVANGFRGAVYPINPRAATIAGRQAYPTLADVPGPVDLAVIAVPRSSVLASVDDCAAAGVKALIVISAGFAEAGDDGRRLQQQLTERVRQNGMRMVGPNCMGVLNADPDVSLNASFSPVFPPPGGVALSSQSGALGIVILDLASRRRVGISSFVSIGNRADVSSNDLIEYWEKDPATSVIALYLESFGNPRRFARLARRTGRTKPILAVKSGRSRAGSRAAGSHTAALAAADVAVDALFRQTGVIRAATIDEMFDLAACLDAQPLPAGRRVAIVTNAGGPGILAVDACVAAGLSVDELSAEIRTMLASFLPAEANVTNPVDMIASASAEQYRRTIETVMSAPDVDALVIVYTPVDAADAEAIVAAIRDGIVAARRHGATNKPVAACLMAEGHTAALFAGAEQVPIYAFPENAARALGKIATYAEWQRAPLGDVQSFDEADAVNVRAICREVIAGRGGGWLTPDEVGRVLTACQVPVVQTASAGSAREAVAAAERLGFPVAAKLTSKDVIHKSDLGGVRLGLRTAAEVSEAFDALAALAAAHHVSFDGVVIQAMSGAGIETMIGIAHDDLFGALVAFGLGGKDVEVLGDVRFGVAPLTDRDIDDLIGQTRAARLIAGYRDRPVADVGAVRKLLARMSWLAESVSEIVELDLNPVIVRPSNEGCLVLDARIRVAAVKEGDRGLVPHEWANSRPTPEGATE